jgi:ATP-binding cassette subfamily C protein
MRPDSRGIKNANLAADLRAIVYDFASFAGTRGIVAAVLVALGALFEGISLALIVPLLGIVTGSGRSFGRLEQAATAAFGLFDIASPLGELTLLLALFGVVMIVRAIVIYNRDTMVADLQIAFVESLRLRVAERLATAPWAELARLRHARITHVMSGDIQRVGAATQFLLLCVVSLTMLTAQCVLVFLLAPLLALLTICILLAGAFVVVPSVRRSYGFGGTITTAQLSLLNSTAQFLNGLKLALSQNLQPGFLAEFRQALAQLRHRQVDFMRRQSSSRLALTTLSAFAGGLLVLVGFGVLHVAPSSLIVLLLVIARMSGPAGQILQGSQQVAYALPAYAAVKELERDLAAVLQGPAETAVTPALPEGAIVFENVSYLHETEDAGGASARGIANINLTIRPRELVGVRGPSGAGKTTFVDLLVGLLAPQQGQITVAGQALQGVTLKAWREHVAYISQDPFLFHDTVRRNLAWVNPRASEDEMWNALTLVGADTLVRGMEQGLETVVGERGSLISGGERQRLALARAVLRKPRLLIMDEATSAIDVAGERQILERLRALSPRPAIVIVAHRAESLASCDRVVQIEGGRCLDECGAAAPLRAVD